MEEEKQGAIGTRYTEAQKNFLKLDPQSLTEEERAQLHLLLLPRTAYLPAKEEECAALAEEILGKVVFGKMCAFAKEIETRFDASGFWGKGDKFCLLYYRLRAGGKTLCSLGIVPEKFFCVIQFGRTETEKFETLRDTFPRAEIQWTYDFANEIHGIKRMSFQTSDESVFPHLMRLISIKRNPSRAVSGIECE